MNKKNIIELYEFFISGKHVYPKKQILPILRETDRIVCDKIIQKSSYNKEAPRDRYTPLDIFCEYFTPSGYVQSIRDSILGKSLREHISIGGVEVPITELFIWHNSYPIPQLLHYWDTIHPEIIGVSRDRFEELSEMDLPKDFRITRNFIPRSILFIVDDNNTMVMSNKTTLNSTKGQGHVDRVSLLDKLNKHSGYFDLPCLTTGSETISEIHNKYVADLGEEISKEIQAAARFLINSCLLLNQAVNVSFKKEEFNDTRIQLQQRKASSSQLNKHKSYYFVNLCNPVIRSRRPASAKLHGMGSIKSEHLRRAHWHTYWYKNDKGEKETKLIFLPLTIVAPGVAPVSQKIGTLGE